jgi:virulence factor Mce-like protein
MKRRRDQGWSPFTVGAIALVVAAVALFLGFTKSIPFLSHYEIKAAFRTSNNIKPNSPVRIAGVEVGKVTAVEPTAPGAQSAFVTMRIKDAGRPIHSDARAVIRPRIFLEGNFFIDLTPGSPGRPVLDDGDMIPADQTATPVQFDQVLKALKAPTRRDLQLTLGELGGAFDKGFAKAFNESLADQAPAYRFTAVVLEAMQGRQPHDLSRFVADMGTVSAALDRSPPRLQSLLENFDTFAGSLARERDALGRSVAELPRTLAAADPAFDALNAAFPPTRRFAREAIPGVRASGPTIDAVRPLVAQLRGLVSDNELRGLSRDLRGATPGLVGLAKASVPLLGEFRSLSSCANEVLLPWSHDKVQDPNFPATGPVSEEGVKWLPGVAGESRSFDANGQWFKVLGSGGAETFQLGKGVFGTAALPIEGVNPPKPTSRPPLRPDVPCETQVTPDLRTKPGQAPQRAKADWSSPEAQARYAKSKVTATEWLRGVLKADGIDLPVLDREATLGDLQGLAGKAGHLSQMSWLKRSLKP